jgi:hypothetical protein
MSKSFCALFLLGIVFGFQIRSASAHHIGESLLGGVVFWVDINGEHGYIADLTDLKDASGNDCFAWSLAEPACIVKHGTDGTWYLPSQEQLRTLCYNKDCTGIGNSFQISGECGSYWSKQTFSSSGGGAYTVIFSDCKKSGKPLMEKCHARAIRNF